MQSGLREVINIFGWIIPIPAVSVRWKLCLVCLVFDMFGIYLDIIYNIFICGSLWIQILLYYYICLVLIILYVDPFRYLHFGGPLFVEENSLRGLPVQIRISTCR